MRLTATIIFALLLTSCSAANKPIQAIHPISPEQEIISTATPIQEVVTSHYCRSLAGNKTASGEIYNPTKFTSAHKTLPFGTMIKVRNPINSKEVIVKINDRGPFIRGRELDLSNAAAEKLNISGVQKVEMQILR